MNKRWYSTDVPDECQCDNVGMPSPWHCRCRRWKPSTDAVCEVCSGDLRRERVVALARAVARRAVA